MTEGDSIKLSALRTGNSIILLSVVTLFTLTLFIARQHCFLTRELHELKKLKKEYHLYIARLKEVAPKESAQKKKAMNFEQSHTFTPVNRSSSYLKKAALAYGKKKGLSSALFRLYDAQDLVSYERKKSLLTSPTNNLTKKKISATSAIRTLKKEVQLLCPLNKGSFLFSSKFGPRRRTNGSWGFHKGLDMAAPEGTPIKAAAAGEVLEACWSKGYGNTVVIAHSASLATRYAHLSKISVARGATIKEGETIGLVGNTGRVRSSYKGGGHHLHFEVHLYGKAVNPLYFISRS